MKKICRNQILCLLVTLLMVVISVVCLSSKAFAGSKIIEPGTYNIITAVNTKKAIDVPGGSQVPARQLQIYDQNYTTAQALRLEYKNGYYVIRCTHSNMVLDVKGGKAKNSVAVIQYPYNGKSNQKWEIKSAGGGYYYIKSALGNYYLDVAGGKSSNGTKLQIYHGNGTKAQKFKFVSSVYYEYKTKTLNFNTVSEWQNAMQRAQRDVIGITNRQGRSMSGQMFECGAMIVGIEVLEYKSITYTAQYGHNVGSKVKQKMKLPKKIKFKLHKHKFGSGLFAGSSNLFLRTECTCGYIDVVEWEIPWPDTSDAQKASKATKVTYTNKFSVNYR